MKKVLSLLLALVLVFSMCMVLVACEQPDDPDDNTGTTPPDNGGNVKPFKVDLAGYVANIGNATALGISQATKTNTSPRVRARASMMPTDTNKIGGRVLRDTTSTADKNSEDKNYIVMSTTSYDANTPEADENGLTKVTFTKIVTENATTEITGTKLVTAKHGQVSINGTHGFTYSLYQGETLLQSQVADNGETDKPNKKVHVVFEGLTDGVEYTVKYRGIGVETTITQEEINGEIDKLCVMNGYTFVSFVPIGTSKRPTDTDSLEKDNSGYIAYDREDYYSDNSRQSFVISNTTGYVYPIKDVTIQKLYNNLLYINNLVYDYNIVDDNLNFYPLFTNTTIKIVDYMKDKYGNNYVITDKLSTYDETTKTTYLLENLHKLYFLLPNNEVMHIYREEIYHYDEYTGESWIYGYYNCFRKLNSLGEPIRFTEEDNNMNINVVWDRDWGNSDVKITQIRDGYIYMHDISNPGVDSVNFMRSNLETDYYETTAFGCHGDYAIENTLTAVWVDDNHVVFYTDLVDGTGELYTAQVWKTSGKRTDGIVLEDDPNSKYFNDYGTFPLEDYINRTDEIRPVLLLDNCVREYWNNFDYTSWKLSVSGLTSTEYYKIVMEDGQVRVVNAANYVAPEPLNYTLYPLN